MTMSSFLQQRHCLVWKTEKPSKDRPQESSVFFWMNSEWFLRMTYDNQHHPPTYAIRLVKDVGETLLQPFSVTLFLEDGKNFNKPVFCKRSIVSSRSEAIWQETAENISKEVPEFEVHGDFTIVCVFYATMPSALLEIKERKNDKATQVSSDAASNLECPFLEDSKSNVSESASDHLNYRFSMGDLTEDFGILLEKSILSDVQLRIGEQIFPVHKAVLAVRSLFFDEMFREGRFPEGTSGIIDIDDVEPPVMNEFLKFIYSAKLSPNLSEDMITKLYRTSYSYAVRSLTMVCFLIVVKSLNEENFVQNIKLADSINDRELKEAVISFVTERPALLTSDLWIKFSEEFPKLANEIYRAYFAKLVSKGVS